MKITFFSPYLFLLLVTQPYLQANTIGYIEDFALAPDRETVLKDLIPGTREYYYYHALHAQNQGRHGEVEKLIGLWVKRYGETTRVSHIDGVETLKQKKASLFNKTCCTPNKKLIVTWLGQRHPP